MITPAFDDKWVDNMIMNARDIDEDIRQIFIAIDPAAGKTKNIYALCSCVFLRDGTCIVCLFSLFKNNRETYKTLSKHQHNTRIIHLSLYVYKGNRLYIVSLFSRNR
jgi:hypothetical protein